MHCFFLPVFVHIRPHEADRVHVWYCGLVFQSPTLIFCWVWGGWNDFWWFSEISTILFFDLYFLFQENLQETKKLFPSTSSSTSAKYKYQNPVQSLYDTTNPYVNDGRAEAAKQKIVIFTRCCLIEANLWKLFWGPVSDMIVHSLVRTYAPAKKRIPFTALTGLKPDVSYLRMPGCIALCHLMDQYRQKLDERAFIGILIGYDTSARSWVFLNPKTGRNVRTVFSRCYKRKQYPKEHIDMSSMLLQPPSFERETKVHC